MFLQIAEVRTDNIDEVLPAIVAAEEVWRADTRGRRTGVAERLYADRDVPGRYLAVNEFPSYELAMENSDLPETSSLAQQVGELVDVPLFWNLDLVVDMRSAEFDALAAAVVEVFATGRLDPSLFAEDVILDVNVPSWRFQVKGRVDVERALREEAPEGNNVESWCSLAAGPALVLEVVTRGRQSQGGLARQLCVACLDRGRISSMVVYCTGVWDRDIEASHAQDVPLVDAGFVWRAS